LANNPSDEGLALAHRALLGTRPTAINLRWALDRVRDSVSHAPPAERSRIAREEAIAICNEDTKVCEAIGDTGLPILEALHAKHPERRIEILTHCNAGWLATVDWGTALAPIYKAQESGIPIHVWVDETRPRNQGASLTAFELREQGIPHTVIVDNAGGHLMQRGQVDAVIVGSDRTTATGDVCNKIGTYLKALAAHANGIPFYVALPSSTIDWTLEDGIADIPIENRSGEEIRQMTGHDADGELRTVSIFSRQTEVSNPAFDVTPARYVTALLTEHGVFQPDKTDLDRLRRMLPRHIPAS
jgi:methylthioribose-1-phosphate isomerase